MSDRGRPRILSKQADVFLHLYLDPLMSVEQICKICGIQKTTFYKYEQELQLPQLRVGVGNVNANLPLKKALQSFTVPEEKQDLDLVRRLGPLLRARIKIIPVLSNDANSAIHAVQSKNVDFVISSLSVTKERSEALYFSENYIFDDRPHGVLIRNPAFHDIRQFNQSKPILAVPTSTVHSEYANENLQREFQVRHFSTGRNCLVALNEGNVDFVLLHPIWFKYFPTESVGLEVCSKPYFYNSHAGIAFNSDSEHWRGLVNNALSKLQTESERENKE